MLGRILLASLVFETWFGFNISYAQGIPNNIKLLLDSLSVLSHERAGRELLYQYSIGDLSNLSDKEAELVVGDLAKRGVGVISFWNKGNGMESSIKEGIRIAKIQHKLGLKVVVDASNLLYGFYGGSLSTGHIGKNGDTFFDTSYAGKKLGCPFTLEKQIPIIKSRLQKAASAYRSANTVIDIVVSDWEIDGPLEWNNAWESSKKCTRCNNNLPNMEDFSSFQFVLRSMRSKLLFRAYTLPILNEFPKALITNYATYPNNGYRYWYDYFEYFQAELPHIKDQKALYRPWYNEFNETGFTLAMPVIYTWYPTYNWYPNYTSDYRWFYNMLLIGSNAAESTPAGIPISTFVHWHMTVPPKVPDSNVKQMSESSYKELLWHLLLRGHDIFFSWCLDHELVSEMKLLQNVYEKSLLYNEFFKFGRPIKFDVPKIEGAVISGLKLRDKVLVRRTDFGDKVGVISITIEGVKLLVPDKLGECQILSLDPQ